MLIVMTAVALAPAHARALEAGCDRSEVRELIDKFVAAYNRGDVAYLDQVWAQGPDFFWYFVQDDVLRRGSLAKDRSTLPVYFAERTAYDEELTLRRLAIKWERGWHGAWDIAFELTRRSDHLEASGRYLGKAAATCQHLHAWAMGRDS